MKKEKAVHLALIGTDSLRGREIKNVLNNRSFPLASMEFFDTDVKEAYSKLTQFRGEPKVIAALNEKSLEGMDLVFLAADKKTNRRVGRMASSHGFAAIDLGEAFVDDRDVPVVVAGVNDRKILKKNPPLVANPHPVTVILSHVFSLMRRESNIRRAVVVALQPVSAFGEAGIQELANQSVDMLQSASIAKKVFKAQIAFNLLSQTTPTDNCGFSAVEKQIVQEVKDVLSARDFPLSVSLVQAPVFHTYSLMIFVELEQDVSMESLEAAFRESAYFKFARPSRSCPVSSIAVAGRDEVFVGQLKKDAFLPKSYWLWSAADNLTRGSALNAFEMASALIGMM